MSLQPLPLNELLNYKTRSVGVNHIHATALLAQHQPTDVESFFKVIQAYATKTLDWCAAHAHEEQKKFGCNYSYNEIYDFIFDLMVVKTISGTVMEQKAIHLLRERFPHLGFVHNAKADANYAVDIVLGAYHKRNTELGGIQVKPLSYARGNSDKLVAARASNTLRNAKYVAKFKCPGVYYLYYDSNTSTFSNLNGILDRVAEIAQQNLPGEHE